MSCVSITPFGYAVVPEVNWMSSTSPGETSAGSNVPCGSPPETSTFRISTFSMNDSKSCFMKRGT